MQEIEAALDAIDHEGSTVETNAHGRADSNARAARRAGICSKKAELTFEQPYEVRPQLRGRGWDIAGAVMLGLVGLGGIQSGMNANANDREGNNSIILGSAFIATGVGLLAYSYGVVPNREPAVVPNQRRQWVETRLVEASGCGLPGDVAQAQAAIPVVIQAQPAPAQVQVQVQVQDPAARLQQLDKLRAAGAISEADYARKRKEIIDGI